MKPSETYKEVIVEILGEAINSLNHASKNRRVATLQADSLEKARRGVSDDPQKEFRAETPRETMTVSTSELFSGPAAALGQNLDEIRGNLGECTRCKLHSTRNKIVFGDGNPNAELMFVGEGPGADEDAQGLPFVGRAGKLLTKMIQAMGKTRQDVYIANIIKCRPPGNRDPEADEVKACKPFLLAQIGVIKPKVICTLGNPSTKSLLNTKIGIFKMRGRFHDFDGTPVMPTFHPAFLLRSPQYKKEAWEDLQAIIARLNWTLPGDEG